MYYNLAMKENYDIASLVGNTPLIRLKNIEQIYDTNCRIYAKVEYFNLTGSIKDRPVLEILKNLKTRKIISEGSTIIEATSGNTGISLAALGRHFKCKVIIVMPSSMSKQRQDIMRAYGASLILVEGGMSAANQKANQLLKEIPNSVLLGQFDNENNIKAHIKGTAKELDNQLDNIDYVFAGFGTGGTISGIGSYFKNTKKDKNIKIIALEPESSPLVSQGKAGKHLIQGIGSDFIPANFKRKYVDEVLTVNDKDSIALAKDISRYEGLYVGISSGASLLGALNYIKNNNLKKKNIVVIFPDSGDRYTFK